MPGTGPLGLFLAEVSADPVEAGYDELIGVSRHGRFGNNANLQPDAQLSQNVIAPRIRRRAHCRRSARLRQSKSRRIVRRRTSRYARAMS